MLRFTVRRVISGAILLVAISIAAFFLSHWAFPNPASAILGDNATPSQEAALNSKLGLDQPIITQFFSWIGHAVTGDFGTSWANSRSVTGELASKLPVTLSIVIFATLISAVVGAAFGIVSGTRPGSAIDRVVKMAAVVLFALPGFWVSLVLVIWFAINLKWFPAVGYVQPAKSFAGWLDSITLPAIALSLGAIVSVAEQLRNAVVRVNGQEYVRTLRSRGLSRGRLITHIVRNASPAALTVLALQFVGLLGGAIIVETIFNLPGIGAVTMSAANSADIPMILGITVVSVLFVVIVNLLLDLLLGIVNPKARTS
ncbi:ABC transporter permease [Subtercola sp. YIM 133946]|uniref:ABC transporter permease n=1 Tax=Subtercola sp. YIM 133946 TaxID=3118909 RepID=UPI002F93CF85